MSWQIRIQDPSGETRFFPIERQAVDPLTIGRSAQATIPLRDPTAAAMAAVLQPASEPPYWLEVPAEAPPARVGDLAVREGSFPAGLTLFVGETRLTLEPRTPRPALPDFPKGVRPWLTESGSGARVLWTAKKAAATPLAVYITGETGTGKEVIAHLLHAWSERASGPFVPLHCGALPISLAESELFGHVKGAFTGAASHRVGALMQAHGGTLFLDEVGDLPMDMQVKLLRFLENGEIRPVGSDRVIRADVRILCATHLPLLKLVEEGRFRRDLFFRVASVTIEIPSLRERPKDVRMLATRYAAELARSISHRAMLRLLAHSWPGNVRELRHAVERACGLAGPLEPTLREDSFEFLLTPQSVTLAPEMELGAPVLTMEGMKRAMLLKALRLSGGNRGEAAKILGIARSTLFEMLRRHGIRGPKWARGEVA